MLQICILTQIGILMKMIDQLSKTKIKIANLRNKLKDKKLSKTEIEAINENIKSLKRQTASRIKQVKLEILVEELRKTVLILGKLMSIQNAQLKDDNLKEALNNQLDELIKHKSTETTKKFIGLS